MSEPALLALADGSLFHGVSVGSQGQCVGELIFNTSMTGYQEILSDPSYAEQIINFTYPHIGNVGVNPDDNEARQCFAKGMVIRELPTKPSSWRSQNTLQEYLIQHNIVGIAEVDTRALTHKLRESGAQKVCIMSGHIDESRAIQLANEFPGIEGLDLAKQVSCKESYEWQQPTWGNQEPVQLNKHVIVYDFGVKQNILRLLYERGCRITVVPATTDINDVLSLHPDGVFLSNGPGDPAMCRYAIEAIMKCIERSVPLFGICLGYQLLALACGAKTYKMKFGHHGANHPVQSLESGKVFITSQNHGFAVDEASLPSCLVATHRSLFDNTLQGIAHRTKPAMGFQGHPEASPGPHDIVELFDQFVTMMN